jgi:hypothetical protein
MILLLIGGARGALGRKLLAKRVEPGACHVRGIPLALCRRGERRRGSVEAVNEGILVADTRLEDGCFSPEVSDRRSLLEAYGPEEQADDPEARGDVLEHRNNSRSFARRLTRPASVTPPALTHFSSSSAALS